MEEFVNIHPAPDSVQYEQLAEIYDRIMSHVNYRQWAKYIRNLYAFYPKPVSRIIDISCGTGQLLYYLKDRRRMVCGSDLSPNMLRVARMNRKNRSIPLWCNDATQLAIREGTFEVALMLYDSINYIIEPAGVAKLFGNVADCLQENGLFLFDVVTIKGCRDHFHNYFENQSWGDCSYVRKSWFSSREQIQYNHFSIRKNGRMFIELHRQKIRTMDEWQELIFNSPFEVINFYDNFSYRPMHKHSERVHVLCRKK